MMQAIKTTAVPLITACWFGHSTFLSSAIASWTNRMKPEPGTRRGSVVPGRGLRSGCESLFAVGRAPIAAA